MIVRLCLKVTLTCALCAGLAACGARGTSNRSTNGPQPGAGESPTHFDPIANTPENAAKSDKSSLWDVFGPNTADQKVQVNRYLWAASLDVLGFLPVESVDPFTGVIVTGYGTPPGGGRAYRATVHISDPALEARSLKLSLQTQGGRAASAATTRAVEDAILSRARQLRVRDDKL